MERAKELIARYSKIDKDVWNAQKGGTRNREIAIVKAMENGSTITENMLNTFEVSVQKGEENQKIHDGYVAELERRKAIFDSIANHPDCPIETGTAWAKSFNPLKSRYNDLKFSADGKKYVSGKLDKETLGKLKVDVLTNLWSKKLLVIEKDKEKQVAQKKGERDKIIKSLPGFLAKYSAPIMADAELKQKSERIQELIPIISVDETHDLSEVSRLADELRKVLEVKTKVKKQQSPKGESGTCGKCGESKDCLFGERNLCGDCYLDKDFNKIYEKLHKEFEAFEKLPNNRRKFIKFEDGDWKTFDDAYEDFQRSHTQKNFENLMRCVKICQQKLANPSLISEDDDLGSDDEEDSRSSDEEEEEEEEEEYEPRRGKKRGRDEDDLVEKVLDVSRYAPKEDMCELFEKYKKNKTVTDEDLEGVRNRLVKYGIFIYFNAPPDGEKSILPHPYSNNVYYSREEAEKVGQEFIKTMGPKASSFYFVEVEILKRENQ